MGDPSKAASKATQHAVLAAMCLGFAVFFALTRGVLIGAGWVLLALVYVGLAVHTARNQKRSEITADQPPARSRV
jgi:hypothetical protein